MLPPISSDVSQFQRPVTLAYSRPLLIFRASFGPGYEDPNFLANANGAAALYKAGKIIGAIPYMVPLASASARAQCDFFWKLVGPRNPNWLLGTMADAERWPGTSYAMSGDHSALFTEVTAINAHRLNSWNGSLGYGNAGDLASIWPHRDPRTHVIVANYSSQLSYRSVRGGIGQQYTDGEARYPVPVINGVQLPRASTPFGSCDHNVFPFFHDVAGMKQWMHGGVLNPVTGVVKPPPPKPAPKPPAPKGPIGTHGPSYLEQGVYRLVLVQDAHGVQVQVRRSGHTIATLFKGA